MEKSIIGWGHQKNGKLLFSKIISFLIIANFLLIFIKGEDNFNTFTNHRQILSNIEDNDQQMMISKGNLNQEHLLSLEHFEVNFQRILKFSDRQFSYFQPFFNSYLSVDEEYKSINKSLFQLLFREC